MNCDYFAGARHGARLFRRVLLLASLAIIPRGAAHADSPGGTPGQCISYGTFMHPESQFEVQANIGAMIYQDGFVFATNWLDYPWPGHSQLMVINFSNPASPSIESVFDFTVAASLIGTVGSLAYVTSEDSTLIIVNMSDPASPAVVNTISVPGVPGGMTVSGSNAFMVEAHLGFLAFDISDPRAPVLIGSVALPSYPGTIALSGHLAYVADYDQGVQVIDVALPAAPRIVGHINLPGYARKILISGSYAYVMNDTKGIQILDISALGAETLLSNIPGFDRDFILVDSRLMIADGCNFHVWDVSDPRLPAHIVGVFTFSEPTQSVTLAGNHLIVREEACYSPICRNLLHVFTAGDSPPVIGSFNSPGISYDVALAGTTAYIADEAWGLTLVDIANPGAPTALANLDTPGSAGRVAVNNGYAYVADGPGGLQIIDASNPTAPARVGALGGSVLDVAVSGQWVFAAAKDSGFQVVDVSDPSAPRIRATIPGRGGARRVAVRDSILYGADNYGLLVVNISNPLSPLVVDSRTDGAYSLCLTDSKLLIGYWNGLSIYDATDPNSPSLLGSVETPEPVNDIAAENDVAYAACGLAGLQVIDMSNPNAPVLIGGAFLPADANAVAASNGYVFLTDGARIVIGCHGGTNLGLLVFPSQCQGITGITTIPFWATSQEDGLLVQWESTDSGAFTRFVLEKSTFPDRNYQSVLDGNMTGAMHYLDTRVSPGTTYYYRLQALDRAGKGQVFGPLSELFVPQGSRGAMLRPSVPNPVRSARTSTLSYFLPKSGQVRLDIFDLSGRRVATLVDVFEGSGSHSVLWDGRNEDGSRVPAGTYFARLSVLGREETTKIELLR